MKDNVFKMKENDLIGYINRLQSWRIKVDFLKDQIDKLAKLKDFPIFCIAAFLLKTQIIEFELKEMFISLDLEVAIKLRISNSDLTREIRDPSEFDNKTLGQIITCFCEYNGIVTVKLKKQLHELNSLRNKFTHHIFDAKTETKSLTDDAEKGLTMANDILDQLSILSLKLKEKWEQGAK
jgi:hypothetical protein